MIGEAAAHKALLLCLLKESTSAWPAFWHDFYHFLRSCPHVTYFLQAIIIFSAPKGAIIRWEAIISDLA